VGVIAISVAISFMTGYLAIAGLLRLLRTSSFNPFIACTLLAGMALSPRVIGRCVHSGSKPPLFTATTVHTPSRSPSFGARTG